MMRIVLLGVAAGMVALVSAGCPTEEPAETADAEKVTPRASAPEAAEVGETVSLTAQVDEDVDPDSITYCWLQTFGRAVEILNADTASASFVAPSIGADQTLTFRIDVITADGTVYSDTVAVTVAADPDYGLDQTVSDDDDDDEDLYPQVKMVTSEGTFTVTLNREDAPLTVNNFLRYVDDGFYDGTIFHRVIADFVIQGGGYNEDLEELETRSPIRNEANNGLTNERGTIAMARTSDYDSATSQFYINLVDNNSLDYTSGETGYAVFGEVTSGMSVVDDIAEVETETRDDMSNIPVEDVVLESVERVSSDSDDDSDDSDADSSTSDDDGTTTDNELSDSD